MTSIVIDAAMSLDGFWADRDGASIYPVEEMHRDGMVGPLADGIGAVVMSDRSFRMADDPDWYADNYELQAPIFVVTDTAPATAPKSNDKLSFTFERDLGTAIGKARTAAAGKDVSVIGEASIVQALIAADIVDYIDLRIIPLVLGGGTPLFAQDGERREFRRASIQEGSTVTHLRFQRIRTEGTAQ